MKNNKNKKVNIGTLGHVNHGETSLREILKTVLITKNNGEVIGTEENK